MSIRIMSAAWLADLPATEKLVLLALADNANDEGHCWPAVSTIMRKCGHGERTVRRSIKALIDKGHLKQNHRSGTSAVYTVNPCQSGTPATVAPLPDRQDTPATVAPKPSRTVNQKKDKPSSEARASQTPARRLSDDWEPMPLQPGTVTYGIVAAWQPGRIERELSKFRDYWASASGQKARKHDWQAAWRTWIGNADEFGSRNDRSNQRPSAWGQARNLVRLRS